MDTVHSSDPIHRELELLLPWYVKGRLDAAEARQVQAHLAQCPTCRAEADGLAALFAAHERTMTDRPVDEARLSEVFARIDAYEAQRAKRAGRTNGRNEPMHSSVWASLGAAVFGLLSARPALLASTFAAVALAVIAVPMLRTPAADYGLLSSGETAPESLSVRLRVSGNSTQQDVERLVQSSLRERKMQGKYRVSQHGSGEYIVTLEQKPSIDAMSRLIADWQKAPNVTDVAIDAGGTP
jgi:anti-sigma factor RsiW